MVSVLKICYLYFVYRGRWELFEATGTSVRKGSNKLTVMATHSQPNWRSFNHILEFHKWQWIIHLLHPSRFLLLLFGVFSVCVCVWLLLFVLLLLFCNLSTIFFVSILHCIFSWLKTAFATKYISLLILFYPLLNYDLKIFLKNGTN